MHKEQRLAGCARLHSSGQARRYPDQLTRSACTLAQACSQSKHVVLPCRSCIHSEWYASTVAGRPWSGQQYTGAAEGPARLRTANMLASDHITLLCLPQRCSLQALVYFAVSKKGETPIDGKTDANPEGLTAVTGKHAQAFAARLAGGDLSCKVLSRQAPLQLSLQSSPFASLLKPRVCCLSRYDLTPRAMTGSNPLAMHSRFHVASVPSQLQYTTAFVHKETPVNSCTTWL